VTDGLSIAEQVRAFHAGEEKGFNFFFREHYKGLTLFAYRITHHREAAEEIAEDALMKLWEKRAGFNHPLAIKSFLYTAARFASLNYIRNLRRETLRARQLAYLTDERDEYILQDIISSEIYAEVFEAIKTLPPRCRLIFEMIYLQERSYQEIAVELNLSVSTVRNQKARALMLLRKQVDPSILGLFWIFIGLF